MNRLSEFFWVRVPLLGYRISYFMGEMFSDGLYLSGNPILGAYAPFVALGSGVFLGGHFFLPSETFTSSVWVLAYLVFIASVSSTLGFWTWVGYVGIDCLFCEHLGSAYFIFYQVNYPITKTILNKFPCVFSWFLLGVLIVIIPQMARRLNGLTKKTGTILAERDIIVCAVYQSFLTYVWMEAAPILIRPVYVWKGWEPPINEIAPMQHQGWILSILVLGIVLARGYFERLSQKYEVVQNLLKRLTTGLLSITPRNLNIPSAYRLPFKITATLFVLSGLMTVWWEIPILFVGLTFAFWLQEHPFKEQCWFQRAPVILRITCGTFMAYTIGYIVVCLIGPRDVATFLPVILAVIFSQIAFALLFPETKTI